MEVEVSPGLKDFLEWIYCIIIAIILALLVKFYIGVPTIVQQVSMNPTLVEGQRLILDRTVRTFNTKLERGDIVTFEAPDVKHISANDVNFNNPVAKYKEPKTLIDKFVYYVLETSKQSYIKRVIGLPGDHVSIKGGKVYINGEELDEPYLASGIITDENIGGYYTDIIVPEGYYFLMGDNRPKSTDCRNFGCIPADKIESRVLIRFWPLNLFGPVE